MKYETVLRYETSIGEWVTVYEISVDDKKVYVVVYHDRIWGIGKNVYDALEHADRNCVDLINGNQPYRPFYEINDIMMEGDDP